MSERSVRTAGIKPFEDIDLKELAEKFGARMEFYEGEIVRLDFFVYGVSLLLTNADGPILQIRRQNGMAEVHRLADTAVIQDDHSLTFVDSVRRYPVEGCDVFSWITISHKEGITTRQRLVLQAERPKEIYKSPIANAASLAEKRLKEKTSVAAGSQ